MAPASVLSYHRTLSSILTRAVKWGYLQTNPADAAEKPALGRREAAYLDENDARQLLELLQDEPIRWRAIITFDLLSGLRRAELLGLRWQDVDLDAHTITIRQTSNYLPGLGIYVGAPKTDSSARPLPISTAAVMILLEYKRWQDAQREKLRDAWKDQGGRVFTTDMGAPIFPDSVTQWFSAFVARSGLPKVTVHSLRHTFATASLEHGMDVKTLSTIIGHVSSATTLNTYTHITDAMRQSAADKIDRGIGKAEPREQREQAPQKLPPSTFQAHKGQRRKPGTGCVSQINDHLWEGRYSPVVNGRRMARNVYAKTEAECEAKLAALIREMKAEIVAEKERRRQAERAG